MTERHFFYIVALDKDIREDDAEDILTALRGVEGISIVKPVKNIPDDALANYQRDREQINSAYPAMAAVEARFPKSSTLRVTAHLWEGRPSLHVALYGDIAEKLAPALQALLAEHFDTNSKEV